MLKEKLEKDYIEAFKAKEADKVSVLRMLRAAVKNAEIDKMKKFEDPDVEAVIRTEVKKLRESLQIASDASRSDLAEAAEAEIKLMASYLPEQMDEPTVRAIVAEKIKELGEVAEKDFGRVTGEVMKVLKGKADGGMVSKVIKELLAGK
jgi:uncharacterized protein